MTVAKSGLKCVYDFNRWSTSGNSCSSDDGGKPLPIPTLGPSQSFDDVPPSHWAYEYIQTLYANNYVAGCSKNPLKYCPEGTMTRAEGAVFVLRGVQGGGYIPQDPNSSIITDVSLESWVAKWAVDLWDKSYTAGCGLDPLIYCPDQGHTRAEGAVFYLRMLHGPNYQPPTPSGVFDDAPVGEWFTRWVEDAFAAGILPACETEPILKVCPGDPLTRSMAAFMMVQAKGLPLSTP